MCDMIFQFVHEEALACELAGYFYAELRDTDKAMQHFLRAHEKYHECGAFGKCDCLFKFVERFLLLCLLALATRSKTKQCTAKGVK